MSRLRAIPVWARWLLTIIAYLIAAAVVIAVIHGGGSTGRPAQAEADAEAEANREGRIAIAEDEAPHHASLRPGAGAATALERAIAADVGARISQHDLTGPLQGVHCVTSGAPLGSRTPFRCTVHSAGLSYTFVAVADEATSELTWCKLDSPPTPGAPLEVPASSSCRA